MNEDDSEIRSDKPQAKLSLLWMVALLCFVGLALVAGIIFRRNSSHGEVNSFTSCVEAGGIIAESYPEQCFINGQSFVNEDQVVNDDGSRGYIGLDEQAALDQAKANNKVARVVERNGQSLPMTMDLVDGRLNLFVRDDEVYRVEVEVGRPTNP